MAGLRRTCFRLRIRCAFIGCSAQCNSNILESDIILPLRLHFNSDTALPVYRYVVRMPLVVPRPYTCEEKEESRAFAPETFPCYSHIVVDCLEWPVSLLEACRCCPHMVFYCVEPRTFILEASPGRPHIIFLLTRVARIRS